MARAHQAMMRVARVVVVAAMAAVSSAHVGTYDAFYVGSAGPYRVQVTVRAPGVVPGLAQITVRVGDSTVRRVTTQAARWNVGTRGAPRPDNALRVPGDSSLWSSQLWLMTSGAHAINIGVEGASGAGAVTVPFNSIPTRRLAMPRGLGWVLAGLALFLVAGLTTIVGAGARDAVLSPGLAVDARRRHHGRVAMAVGAGVIAAALMLGRGWWNRVDAAYRRGLFTPLRSSATVREDGADRLIRLALDREEWRDRGWAPLVPDHGKLVHLFLVSVPDTRAFAHLHPVLVDSLVFEALLGHVPAGEYRYYADVVHETGFSQTATGTVSVAAGPPMRAALNDEDDAVHVDMADSSGVRERVSFVWSAPDSLVQGRETILKFAVRDSLGRPARLEPYMGMPGHAAVVRLEGDVFAHLHSMGSISAASLAVLQAIERGDTLPSTRPNAPRPRLDDPLAHAAHAMPEPELPSELEFPFAFPQPGRYRIWVQVRSGGSVHTASFTREVLSSSQQAAASFSKRSTPN